MAVLSRPLSLPMLSVFPETLLLSVSPSVELAVLSGSAGVSSVAVTAPFDVSVIALSGCTGVVTFVGTSLSVDVVSVGLATLSAGAALTLSVLSGAGRLLSDDPPQALNANRKGTEMSAVFDLICDIQEA